MKKKVLIVSARNYFPLDGGDKVVSIGLIKLLKDADLTVFNISDEKGFKDTTLEQITPFCKEIYYFEDQLHLDFVALFRSYFNGMPYYKARRKHVKKRKKDLLEIIQRLTPDIIIWDHMRSCSYFVKNCSFNILLEHNNEVEIYKERIAQYPFPFNKMLQAQIWMLQSEQRKSHLNMQKIVFLNEADIHGVNKENKLALKYIMPDFSPVDYIARDNRIIQLLFVGSLDWYPNREGIVWFIKNVMPKLPENYHLNIVGRNPDDSLKFMVNGDKRINLFANVPSTAIYYSESDVFISPVFTGSGINIKILEAASFGMPIVSTGFSKKGYSDLEFIKDADNPETFVEQILLLSTSSERIRLSNQIRSWYQDYIIKRSSHLKEIFLQMGN